MTTALDTSVASCLEAAPAAARPEFSGPSLVRDGEILARGVPIGELIGSLSFVEMLFFQIQSRRPTALERRMMDAYLVSLCEHGVTSPSTHGPRVTASVRAPFAATAISFIATAMGPYHFGALPLAMQELLELDASGESVQAFLDRRAAEGQRIWGYGHRFHKSTGEPEPNRSLQEDADPRVRFLIRLREIGRLLHSRKRIPINIDGLAAGLLLDMGFTPDSALLFVMIGRLPNIARLHIEEQDESANRFTALATREDPGFDRTIDRDLPEARP
jgi:citrate synthase